MKPASPGYGAAGQIGDRKGLDAKLESERLRDTRSEEPTSLLLIAVDAFEELKQEEGTLAVEVTMLTLASALARMLPRQGDLLARYNDSTLAVVLRGTDLAGSLRVAARLRWAIVRMGIANESTASGFLTSSIGLAVQHDLASGRTSNLLSTAEAALAAAQTLGHDSLDYRVLGADSRIESNACVHIALPALRAWSPERAPVLHSPQSQPVA
jgi:diguanylate cyclase (GGDEF)-like protein